MTAANREARIQERGLALWREATAATPGLFDTAYWQGEVMEWVMRDQSFKVDMFRFVDLLPTLTTNEALRDHIREYLLRPERELPTLLSASLKASASRWTGGLAGAAIRKQVRGMAERFIVGESPEAAMPVLRALRQDGVAYTADLLGEVVLSEAESEVFVGRYTALIDALVAETAGWVDDPRLDHDNRGPLPRAQVSLKVSAFATWLDPVDTAGAVARLTERLLPVLRHARAAGAAVTVDMENWDLHGITMDLVEHLALHEDLADWPHLSVAIQAYTHAAAADLERLLRIARTRGAPLGVRLVKGAYWDYETVLAGQQSLPSPVLSPKSATDANFERLSEWLLHHTTHLRPAFGSHNVRSIAHAMVVAEELGLPASAYEFQMLHGMAEHERAALVRAGQRLRVYTPIGELLPGMAYLVRRLLENTSNQSFLRMGHHDAVDPATLLARPEPPEPEPEPEPADASGFRTCPPIDFTDAEARAAFAAAVATAEEFPINVHIMIDGQEATATEVLERHSPNDPAQLVARVDLADAATAELAVERAYAAWPAWRDRPLGERVALLAALADGLTADRLRLAAIQIHEVAKPWREADADVAEAIDFCRYYAQQALVELPDSQHLAITGERNVWRHDGHGPAVIIAPWNFPLAILTGMATAALVAGCPVILKPAEQSSAVADALYWLMMEAGFPPDVVQFVPGIGEDIGPALVSHPLTAVVAFTGSRAVGLEILRSAHTWRDGQPQLRHVVCEMGGKNAIIVDEDADLDEAVAGCLRSAFGFAGQKCSAASRIITVGSVTESFIARFVEATAGLPIGPASDPACVLPPVVDHASVTRLMAVHRDPGDGATVLHRGTAPANGQYVPPLVLRVDDPQHPLMQRELFGPIVCICHAPDFAAALDAATTSEYALTGAVYSRQPSHLAAAEARFRVGNLYLNRGSTGALVGRQPFGGFGLSGTGSKAGGPGYLAHFTAQRTITENTMRRGFTPDS